MIAMSHITGAILGVFLCSLGLVTEKNDEGDILWHIPPILQPVQKPYQKKNIEPSTIIMECLFIEVVCTFLFVVFVLQVCKHNGDSRSRWVNSLSIGISLYACQLMAGSISGGCLNPAVGLIQIPF